mgnify:CR=1 FL=1
MNSKTFSLLISLALLVGAAQSIHSYDNQYLMGSHNFNDDTSSCSDNDTVVVPPVTVQPDICNCTDL